jgi:hypothetical protein
MKGRKYGKVHSAAVVHRVLLEVVAATTLATRLVSIKKARREAVHQTMKEAALPCRQSGGSSHPNSYRAPNI